MENTFRVLKKINRYLLGFEKVLICTLLFTMIVLSFGQIIGRKLSISFLWIGPFLRVQVLWIVFLGAALASEYRQHIKIDFLANIVQSNAKKIMVNRVAKAFAMLVCLALFLISLNYMRVMGADNAASMLRGVPDRYILLIIPYTFFMMFVRSLFGFSESAPKRQA